MGPYETRLEAARRRLLEQERLVAIWRETISSLTAQGQSTELAEKMLQLMERRASYFPSRPRQACKLGRRARNGGPARYRADSGEMCGTTAVVPEGVQPPACPVGPGQRLCTDAGSARARPLGVSEVESRTEATVGPSCGVHLSAETLYPCRATGC
jgi:hypothetical protein